MFDRIEFLISEAFIALRRNGWMTFAAMSTSAIALFFLGGLGYAYFRANQTTTAVASKFEINVFVKDEITRSQEKEFEAKLKAVPGVKTVIFMPKEVAWEQLKAEHPHEYDGMDNAYPDGYHLTLTEIDKAGPVGDQIQAMPEVIPKDGVIYPKDLQKTMSETLAIIRWLGAALGIVLLATSGVLIYNAIRLTVISRRREIRIMQLVGASYSTIWTPFVIEGVIQGAIGGVVASLLLRAAQAGVVSFVQGREYAAVVPEYPIWLMIGLLAGTGALYGFFCSSFAVREPLKIGAAVQR